MNKILVPTDFSKYAQNAAETAISIAKQTRAEVHFMHIQITPLDWVKLDKEKEDLYPETKAQIGHSKQELNKLEQRCKKEGVNCKTHLLYNQAKIQMISQIGHEEYDLIVMGSHGSEGMEEALMIGSNTQKVVRKSDTPVLVVKGNNSLKEIKDIVFASEFEKSSMDSFKKLLVFARSLDAKIHLLNVNLPFYFQETEESLELMKDFSDLCEAKKCSVNIYNARSAAEGIEAFSKKLNADIIALSTHGKSGLTQLFSPSITEKLVNHSDLPILSFHRK